MGIEDQFKDKAEDLRNRAQSAIGVAKEEDSPHGQEAQGREQQEQDAQDGDEN